MLVYKKALMCRDSRLWIWDFVILTLDVDPSTVVRPYGGINAKMRAPKATVISCEVEPKSSAADRPWSGSAATNPDRSALTATHMAKWLCNDFEPILNGDIRSWYALIRYEVGQEVVADRFNDDPEVSCTHGIHFFATKEEAKRYYF